MTDESARLNDPTGLAGSESVGSPGRFAMNTVSLVASRLVIALVGWAGTVLIARELGTEGFGQFTLIFSLLGMLSIVTDLGVGRVAVSALMDTKIDRPTFAGTYIILRALLGVVGYIIVLIVVIVVDYPSVVVRATAVAGLVVVLATPSHAYDIAFQVRDRLSPLAVMAVVGRLGQLGFTIVVLLRGGSLVWFVVPAVLNDLVVLLWKVPAAHRILDFRYRIDLSVWRALLKEALPLSAGAAFVTLYYRVDSVMLSKMDSFESVGLYGVAYKFVDLVHFVPTAVGIALLVPLTAAWPNSPDRFHVVAAQALRLLAVSAGAALAGFWLFSSDLAALLYGESYRSSGFATAVVVTAETFAYGAQVAITALIATGRHRWYPVITLSGLALNIGLNLVLIPAFSFEGAAVATLATEALVLALLWTRFTRIPGWSTRGALRPLTLLPIALGSALLVGYLLMGLAHWTIAAAASQLTYLGFVVVFGVIKPKQIRRDWQDR